jgi:hypothetical protein
MGGRLAVLLLLAAAGCNDDGRSSYTGQCPPTVCTHPGVLCTSASCATAPCTSGCVFQAPVCDTCSGALAYKVLTTTASQCKRFCAVGGASYPCGTSGAQGHCFHFDRQAHAGCDLPMCALDPTCNTLDITMSATQAAICPANDNCDDGSTPPDAGTPCDLAP